MNRQELAESWAQFDGSGTEFLKSRKPKAEEVAAKNRRYREAHREELAANKRRYYEAHREELRKKRNSR